MGKFKKVMLYLGIIIVGTLVVLLLLGGTVNQTHHQYVESNWQPESNNTLQTQARIQYTPLETPNINSSFKSWMSYKAITNRNSKQYKFIGTWGWSDNEGFMRCSGERDLGIDQDYYLIALGSYYGTQIGTKYRITLDTGRVFYGALADCKDNKHTNSTNQYIPHNGNIVEFLVDTKRLNKNVKQMGSANVYMPLNGRIVKIERMDFIY